MIDTELIIRCQLGDEKSYDELYKVIGKRALWTAYLHAGRMDIAEDIIQETFFECFRDINKLRKPETFSIWFNRILVRKCWYVIKKERKQTTLSLDDGLDEHLKDETNVSEIAETNQTYQVLKEAVNKLSPPMRTTIILHYYNNMTIEEIAKVMKCFQGTVKSRLYYAKRTIKEILSKEMEFAESDRVRCDRKECIVNE